MSTIKNIVGRKIVDSRGNYTLEVDVVLDNGIIGRESVPSGASTGTSEVFKLADIDKAVKNVEVIKNNLLNHDPSEQEKIDLLMINTDGTKQKKSIGGNVLLAISLAVCEAAAKDQKMPLYEYINKLSSIKLNRFKLPIPLFNIINGGVHADNNLPFQEFMIMPKNSEVFSERLDAGVKVYHHLKKHLKELNLSTNVGDEGGFAPAINTNEEAMELVVTAIKHSGLKPSDDVSIALDVAATAIADLNAVTYPLNPIEYYEKIITEYPIDIIEDPLAENEWDQWSKLTEKIGSKVKIVGDDIFTTNQELLKKGIESKVANAVLIKPDQIGTLSETLSTVKLAQSNNYDIVISHRSGETESTFISDLSVGVGAGYIKTGAPSRGERVAKYNQLLRIEEMLKKQ